MKDCNGETLVVGAAVRVDYPTRSKKARYGEIVREIEGGIEVREQGSYKLLSVRFAWVTHVKPTKKMIDAREQAEQDAADLLEWETKKAKMKKQRAKEKRSRSRSVRR